MEGWLSGWKRTLGKRVYSSAVPRVRIPSLPPYYNKTIMTTLFNYPYIWLDDSRWTLTQCSWPVIINEDKVLVHISDSTGKYQFIWGRLSDEFSLKENAIATAEEVLWHRDITLQWEPLSILWEIQRDWNPETIILFHYKATLADTNNIWKWEWKTLDEILQLEKKDMISSRNIVIASEYFLNK